jgi:hypothetical protein
MTLVSNMLEYLELEEIQSNLTGVWNSLGFASAQEKYTRVKANLDKAMNLVSMIR